ncbi:MAG: hypothetical protein E2O53_12645 [Gammaproteobacteria bacterium]|nr:MAG: hypothetical protein E2O53_12645 [Gammaproteobacteria bacterium]
MAEEADEVTENNTTLELFFVVLIGLAFVAAFIAALNYDFVSARTPLVILVPLLILIGAQINRTRKATNAKAIKSSLSRVAAGKDRKFKLVAGMSGWIVMLMLLIFFAGHYVGVATFMYILLNVISKESKLLSALVSTGVTAILYVLFEIGFNIEMYRGLIYNFLSGYLFA